MVGLHGNKLRCCFISTPTPGLVILLLRGNEYLLLFDVITTWLLIKPVKLHQSSVVSSLERVSM
jgi:hypothetical protein